MDVPRSDFDIITVAAYLSLGICLISLWWPRRSSASRGLFMVSLLLALLSNIVSVLGLLLLGGAAVCLHALMRNDKTAQHAGLSSRRTLLGQVGLASGFAVIAVGIATGLLPGFEELLVYEGVELSSDAVPYTLALNYAKGAVGVLILGMGAGLTRSRSEWSALLRPTLVYALITLAAVTALAVALGQVRVDPKWHPLFLVWAVANLLFTCVAEEAFFRAFLQRRLALWLASFKYSLIVAWLIASLLFGCAHLGGGISLFVVATAAGLGYGWAYLKTGRFESAVLVHFLFNTTHFLLLTYPRLE